jgi:hypothetical protein
MKSFPDLTIVLTTNERGQEDVIIYNRYRPEGGDVHMRRAGNIFEQESYRGTGVRTLSGVTLALIICSVISGLAAVIIIANFGAVTARIAIFMANTLSSGFQFLIVIAAIVYFIVRMKWKLRRSFWGW